MIYMFYFTKAYKTKKIINKKILIKYLKQSLLLTFGVVYNLRLRFRLNFNYLVELGRTASFH